MVFSRFLANENLLGVDIGSSSIKIVHAEPSKYGARISQVALCPTPPDSIKEGVIVNVPEVSAAIQFAMRSSGIKPGSAIAAIAGPGVIVRHVQMPKMSEQVLRRSIHFEAAKYISASIEDSIVEFDILGDAEDGQMNVVLVAAPRVMVDSRVEALEGAGLDPLAIDVEAFATLRVLVERSTDLSLLDRTIALLDMGHSHTEINLVNRGALALTRTIPIAGVSLTSAIRNALSCTEAEAEQRKFTVDLNDLLAQSDEVEPSHGLMVVQSIADEMLREIRRSINYYQSQLPDISEGVVDKLVLTGGTSKLRGLLPYANVRLNIETAIGVPAGADIAGLSAGADQLAEADMPLFTVALGLVMKEMEFAPGARERVLQMSGLGRDSR